MKEIWMTMFALLFFVPFVLAEDISINVVEGPNDVIVHDLNTRTMGFGFDRILKCDVSGQACLGDSCKTLVPDTGNLNEIFFYTGASFDYSLTQGYEYTTTLDCEDELGDSISKSFSFNVAEDAGEDTTPPEFSLEESNIPGVWSNVITSTIYSSGYIILQPELDELVKCSYSISSCESSDSCSDSDGSESQSYGMFFKEQIDNLADGRKHTITLTCEDLSGNSESKTITVYDETSDDSKVEEDEEKKVKVCHIPPGNPENKNYIYVDESDVDDHLAHGDYLGLCKYENDHEKEDKGDKYENDHEKEDKGDKYEKEEDEVIDEVKELDCDGCLLDERCYNLGYRKSGDYCSESDEFVSQLEEGGVCENNFECSSNVCVSGECISPGFIQKIINFFKKLFGGI